jgi:hypothetical protein
VQRERRAAGRPMEVLEMRSTKAGRSPHKENPINGAPGQWVVVHRGVVIARDDNMTKMLQLAEKYPEEEVYIAKVLFPGASFY